MYFREVYSISKSAKAFAKENFGSPHTSNRIYLLQYCCSNNVDLKTMYITLKGIYIRVKNLLIHKFLNFTAIFTEKIISKVCMQYCM